MISGAPPDRSIVRGLVQAALEEDGASQDLTTNALIPPDQAGHAMLTAKQAGVVCGLGFAEVTFEQVEPVLRWEPAYGDGAVVRAGATLARISGPLHGILRGERVALNFLQHLSGVATMTAAAVAQIAHTEARILATRKTTPGLRIAERYAVRAGGGLNHRFNLSSAILIKDNHVAAQRAREHSLGDAVRTALAGAGPGVAVEVEVMNQTELLEALEAGAGAVLLDNFEITELQQAATIARERGALSEASGGITLNEIVAVAETGVDFISLGALTHSAPVLDISLNLEPEG